MTAGAAAAPGGSRRVLVTICTMAATIMQALDTTIANVALPYMQGSLSASLDQINWVLTSYIVAAAIMTAPIGWLSDRFGRKRLFVVCAAGFTAGTVPTNGIVCRDRRAGSTRVDAVLQATTTADGEACAISAPISPTT
jgi:hypothetical protein